MAKSQIKGFSILEISVVIILIGVLAALVFPSFNNLVLKGKNQEAQDVLLAIYLAQKDYEVDNNAFATSIVDLDIAVPAPINFTPIYVPSSTNCGGSAVNTLARMTAVDGGYVLHLLETGKVVCTPCPGGICEKMGFSTF